MKKITLIIPVLTLLSFFPDQNITPEEARSAANYLSQSKKNALKAAEGLSESQLKFRPSATSWSIEECVIHIAASEKLLRQLIDENLKTNADPAKRSEVRFTDENVKKIGEDRSTKVKTLKPLEPENTGIKTYEEAVKIFMEGRENLISFIKSSKDDLRNHYVTLPVGTFDIYQTVLFTGAHSNRHVMQINEIKSNPGFPKH